MAAEDAEVAEMKRRCARIAKASEGSCTYYLLEGLRLPAGCRPKEVDALLCIGERDGYPTRLFLSTKVENAGGAKLNWNGNEVHILARNWFAYSWKVPADLGLSAILDEHMKPLQC